jgi:hypothetical protein
LRSAAGYGLIGGRIYDAHIGEVARAGGAKIVVTENKRHFAHFEMRILSAVEFAAEARLGPARRI